MKKIISLLISSTFIISNVCANNDIYVIPQDVKCDINKKQRVTICKDLKGNLITGEMHKYLDKRLIRSYPLVNGLLEGIAISYNKKGVITSNKTYTKGKQNGLEQNFYKNGNLESEVSYVNGKKEGVAKFYYKNQNMQSQGIFISNMLNGPFELYDINGDLVVEYEFANDEIISGYCVYKKTSEEEVRKFKRELKTEQINAINKKQIMPKLEITENECTFIK